MTNRTTSATSNPSTNTAATADSTIAATARPSVAAVPRRTATVSRGDRRRHTSPLLAELDREWGRMHRRPQTLRRVRAWADDPILTPVVAELRDLDELIHVTQPGVIGHGVGDKILRQLITRSADDELAGRIVLQRMLPGLISRSRPWNGHTRGGDACDIAIGAAWLAIRTYDVAARERHVAPSLIADALWIGLRRDSRKKVEQEVPIAGDVLVERPAPPREATPMAALAGTLRAARRAGVPAADLELMRSIVIAGSPSRAARCARVTVRTIRNRRDAASWKIRQALGPEWADWTDPLVAA